MMINPEVTFFEVTLDNVVELIKNWYDENKYHYVTVNATDSGNGVTIDWIFSKYYDKNKLVVFRAENVAYDAKIPSIVNVIPSAWIAEWELADLFGLDVENAAKGVFIEPDAPQAPLRKGDNNGK
ncbi:MAG: NADH-quinone oxidoreductase subunit C [Nautiliaceae bacterium]|jgi:Ni,Fe-hydrogenase III component G